MTTKPTKLPKTPKPPKSSREEDLPAYVTRFVTLLELDDMDQLVGEIAIALAEGFEEAPAYSRARLASELLGCLDRLQSKVEARRWKREREEREERDNYLRAASNGEA